MQIRIQNDIKWISWFMVCSERITITIPTRIRSIEMEMGCVSYGLGLICCVAVGYGLFLYLYCVRIYVTCSVLVDFYGLLVCFNLSVGSSKKKESLCFTLTLPIPC